MYNYIVNLPSFYGLLKTSAQSTDTEIENVLSCASNGYGLTLDEAAILLTAPESWKQRIFKCASRVNKRIKGQTITFYGVVYIHDYCINDCRYCGDSSHASGSRKLLSEQELITDVKALLHHHPLKEICFLMGEDPGRFNHYQFVRYLRTISEIYKEKIVLNIPPLSVRRFSKIRDALPNSYLHFRVFQETYDREIYSREHIKGPKKDFDWRLASQSRALEAGFNEVGHGLLYGLNDKKNGYLFDTLALIAHTRELYKIFGKQSQSISFPRIQPAPGINYKPLAKVDDDELIRCVSVVKLTEPQIDTVITCRETAKFRRRIRPIVNIEDFAARPGPGGNSIPEVRQQMFLPDMRSGEEVRDEILCNGYTVR